MNTYLQDQYLQIEQSNKDAFLRNEISVDTHWNQPIFGITLQIELPEEIKDRITEYQDQLQELEPNNLLIVPREFQHSSFQQVVYWADTYEKSNEDTWNAVADTFIQSFKAQDDRHKSFQVTFSKLIATINGIIWCAYDDQDEMNALRNTLQSALPFPKGTTKQNHIIHSTVARFRHILNDPQKVIDYLTNSNEVQTMTVDNLHLRKEFVYPSFKRETLASIQLI